MLKALVKVDLETFELFFSDFVRDTLSFYDTVKTPENVYHAFLLGLLIHLNDYEIISNQEAGYGRLDIMVLHKNDKKQPVIIMELKTIRAKEKRKTALKNAIKQIKDKQYITNAKKEDTIISPLLD